jgi:N-acetylneuraminic acid mutarotase
MAMNSAPKTKTVDFLTFLAGFFLLLFTAQLAGAPVTPWTSTGNMATARNAHTATLLSNGKVLVCGGYNNTSRLAGGELHDPATGIWTTTGNLATARHLHTATLLPDGKVLVCGGSSDLGDLASAEVYDPATGTWTSTGSMTTPRRAHTATLLPNGKVLVTGGYNDYSVASAEIFNPATGTWTATGSLISARGGHTATLLPNGKVLVCGGQRTRPSVVVIIPIIDPTAGYLADAEVYDPATGTWTSTGSLPARIDSHTATLLPNGKVLVCGGDTGIGELSSAQLYDPA